MRTHTHTHTHKKKWEYCWIQGTGTGTGTAGIVNVYGRIPLYQPQSAGDNSSNTSYGFGMKTTGISGSGGGGVGGAGGIELAVANIQQPQQQQGVGGGSGNAGSVGTKSPQRPQQINDNDRNERKGSTTMTNTNTDVTSYYNMKTPMSTPFGTANTAQTTILLSNKSSESHYFINNKPQLMGNLSHSGKKLGIYFFFN